MRPIDADALKENALVFNLGTYDYPDEESIIYESDIDEMPTLEVEPVVYATWDMVDTEAFWIGDEDIWMKTGNPTIKKMPVCSHCNTKFGLAVIKYKRCPECGAHMNTMTTM